MELWATCCRSGTGTDWTIEDGTRRVRLKVKKASLCFNLATVVSSCLAVAQWYQCHTPAYRLLVVLDCDWSGVSAALGQQAR